MPTDQPSPHPFDRAILYAKAAADLMQETARKGRELRLMSVEMPVSLLKLALEALGHEVYLQRKGTKPTDRAVASVLDRVVGDPLPITSKPGFDGRVMRNPDDPEDGA